MALIVLLTLVGFLVGGPPVALVGFILALVVLVLSE